LKKKKDLEELCRTILNHIKEDVWGEVANPIQEFFKKTEKELEQNIKLFHTQYEIILPKLILKNMEREVRPTKDGYEFSATIPFSPTKTVTNVIFLCPPLLNMRRLSGVTFNTEFQNDYAGVYSPHFIKIEFFISEKDKSRMQEAFDVRMEKIKALLQEAESIIDVYNQTIGRTFIKEFEHRRKKITESTDFARTIKVSKEPEKTETEKQEKPKQAKSKQKSFFPWFTKKGKTK